MESDKPFTEEEAKLFKEKITTLLKQLKQIQCILLKTSQPVQSRKRKRTALETLQQQGYNVHSEYCSYLDQLSSYARGQQALLNDIRQDLTDISKLEFNKGKDSAKINYLSRQLLQKTQEYLGQKDTVKLPSFETCEEVLNRELDRFYQTRSFPELKNQRSDLLAGTNTSLLVGNGVCALANYHPLISFGLVGGMIATYAYSYSDMSSTIAQEKPDLAHVFHALKWCMRVVNDQLQSSHDTSVEILKVVERCIVSIPLNLFFEEGSLQKATAKVDEPTKIIGYLIEIYQDIIAETKKYKDRTKFSLLLWID
ncbi:hypothetical protein A0J61_00672 [Choanephora cucurbitarum]|uniref:Uncharacterized protein n=1 Tax=Choanephora cucurbitarum TaxID=101091 RepID=A0A1C7NQ93_9FUNG|nr:hypothetical protein A0J61_00672 [Choanephora cucurbitarum]